MTSATSSRLQPLVAADPVGASRAARRAALLAPDPLARVMGLGDRAVRVGLVIGFVVGFGTHVYAAARVLSSLSAMLVVTREVRGKIHEFFWATYDIDLAKADLPKPAEPEPPPMPEPPAEDPAPKAPTPAKAADPYDPPPAPAKAGKVLTTEPKDSDKIEDMSNTIVSGDGPGTHGLVAGNGVGDKPVTGRAVLGGVPGGTGTGTARPDTPPAPAGPDLSKAAGLSNGSGSWSNCPFPPEADGDSIDKADVTIKVTVKPDGSPANVSVVNDPGHGFGRAARQCALGKRYSAALDRTGVAITQATPPIIVHFKR